MITILIINDKTIAGRASFETNPIIREDKTTAHKGAMEAQRTRGKSSDSAFWGIIKTRTKETKAKAKLFLAKNSKEIAVTILMK